MERTRTERGTTEFRKFLKNWSATQGTSSTHYAQSSIRAEAEVRTMKKLIIVRVVWPRKICQSNGDVSHHQHVWCSDEWQQEARRAKNIQVQRYNKMMKTLPPFQVGNDVLIQHPKSTRWATLSVIVKIGSIRGDYLMENDSGRMFRRKRRFLRRKISVLQGNRTSSPEATAIAPTPAPTFVRCSNRTRKKLVRFPQGT